MEAVVAGTAQQAAMEGTCARGSAERPRREEEKKKEEEEEEVVVVVDDSSCRGGKGSCDWGGECE